MKLKSYAIVLAALGLALGLTAIGCADAGTRVNTGDVIRLKYADQNAPPGWEVVQAAQPWLAQIQNATEGKVRIEPYYSETLTKGADAWQAVRNDLADMAWAFHGYWENLTPLADVISLPMLPFTSARQASGILWQLYEKYPTLRDEFKDNQVLLTWTSTPYFLVTTGKPMRTADDLKGMKIRVTNGPPVDMMRVLGALPVTIGMPDTYLYLQKGVIDGTVASWENIISWRLYEVTRYYTYVPLFTVYFSQVMNKEVWNGLPGEVRDQIKRVSGLQGSLFWGEHMFDSAVTSGRDMVRARGYEMVEYTLPKAEQARLNQIAGVPIHEAWVKRMTDTGHPEAREILETTLQLINTYQP